MDGSTTVRQAIKDAIKFLLAGGPPRNGRAYSTVTQKDVGNLVSSDLFLKILQEIEELYFYQGFWISGKQSPSGNIGVTVRSFENYLGDGYGVLCYQNVQTVTTQFVEKAKEAITLCQNQRLNECLIVFPSQWQELLSPSYLPLLQWQMIQTLKDAYPDFEVKRDRVVRK
jgi:hypothetical protein